MDNDTIRQIIDYLNQALGCHYRAQSAINKKHINARLTEGYKFEDFKKVIDFKVQQWGKDATMCEYLRPQTLFGTKFESYLNAAPKHVTVHELKMRNAC